MAGDRPAEIGGWTNEGVQRIFINAGYDDVVKRVEQPGDVAADLGIGNRS